MRILISAYACEPGKGSEPGVGWNWARELAAEHDVWILTRSNNRPAIERELARSPVPRLHLLDVDLPRLITRWKRGQRGVHAYYYLWQMAARREAAVAHRRLRFDLVQHLTIATAFYPAMAGTLPTRFVLGPVGGGVPAPWRFAREWGARGVLYEMARSGQRLFGRYLDPFVRLTWRSADLILVQNPETLARLPARHRARARVLPNAGIDPQDVVPRVERGDGGLRVVVVGRLIHWKGTSLAIRAMAVSGLDDARMVVLGDGPERGRLERLAAEVGVGARVEFRGWVDRAELFGAFAESDVVLFPSLHDDAPLGLVEAMAHGLIPVALDRGGPAVIIGEAGFLSPLGRSLSETVDGLASNLRVAADPSDRERLRARARGRALEFAWSAKPGALFEVLNRAGHHEIVGGPPDGASQQSGI